jgi:5-(carboxyamino)imidazole ribonucleotide synthase
VNIGILGAGQLARMMVLAGRAMGLEFRTLDPKEDSSVGDLCERCVEPYESPAALEWLREGADVVTFDFENVPTRVLHELAQQLPVRPGAAALEATQDRLHEKQLMQRLGIPVAPFRAVETRAELTSAIQELGLPLILKTRRGGYDGKGQVLLREAGDAGKYWDTIAGVPLIAEGFVSFEREISIVAVRGVDGDTRFYRIGENVHDSGILWISRCRPNDPSQAEAESIAASLMAELDYVGVITLEFFETPGGLLVNEFAPRVHNSGHWSIEGSVTSQFENHLRAICGLPLGSTRPLGLSAMLNLVGELPPRGALLEVPGSHVHYYGKRPRRGRKLGHVTVQAESERELERRIARLQSRIVPPGGRRELPRPEEPRRA